MHDAPACQKAQYTGTINTRKTIKWDVSPDNNQIIHIPCQKAISHMSLVWVLSETMPGIIEWYVCTHRNVQGQKLSSHQEVKTIWMKADWIEECLENEKSTQMEKW